MQQEKKDKMITITKHCVNIKLTNKTEPGEIRSHSWWSYWKNQKWLTHGHLSRTQWKMQLIEISYFDQNSSNYMRDIVILIHIFLPNECHNLQKNWTKNKLRTSALLKENYRGIPSKRFSYYITSTKGNRIWYVGRLQVLCYQDNKVGRSTEINNKN